MITSMQAEFDWAAEDIEAEKAEPKFVNRTVSVATGYAAYGFIRSLADKAEKATAGLRVNVYAIRNDFFGENITVAGLLTAGDIIAQLKGRELGEELLLPAVVLRADGDLFLDGLTPDEVSEALSVPLRFIKNDGGELLDAFSGV